jgi:hypothetical protein
MISGAESKDLEVDYATTPREGVLTGHAFAATVLQYHDVLFRAAGEESAPLVFSAAAKRWQSRSLTARLTNHPGPGRQQYTVSQRM